MTTPPPDLASLRIERNRPDPASPARGGRRWPVLLVVLLLAAGAVFVLRPRAVTVPAVTAKATGGPAAAGGGITANGYVVARTKASVSAKIPGRLATLAVQEGSRVRRGQVMARLEWADQEAAVRVAAASLAQAEAQRAQAGRDLDRADALLRAQVLSQAEVEATRTRARVAAAQVAGARAGLESARVALENTNVRAPFDGTVLRKDAEVGEIVAPSSAGGGLTRTAIVTMADLATLEVEVDVNEAYIAQVQNDQPARITLDAYPDTSFRGNVRQVVPTADRQKATVLVKVAIQDHDPRILPEMGAKVEFVTHGEPAAPLPTRITVPRDAVVTAGGAAQVWVIRDGRVHAVAVTLGRARGDEVEVAAGLTGGESLVQRPPAALREGQRVRVAPGH
jgi:HlyD family secretion protein